LDQITIPTSAPKLAPKRVLIGLGLLILYVIWGSTYLGIAVAIETIPPFLMAASRFLIAGGVLLGWSWLREGRAFTLPTRREWRDSAIVGGLLLGGGMGMVAWGQQTVPSGIAALIIALMPAWVAVLGRLFLGERLPKIVVVGIVIGLAGVAILIGPTGDGATAFNGFGIAALILSPICWSGGSLFSAHRATLPSRPLVATGAQMIAGAVVLSVMSVASGELGRFSVAAISRESLLGLVYLTAIGSLVAFTTYVWLLRVAPLPLIATYAYVNPVVAVFLGTWFLSEPLTVRTIVAGGVIVFAVALIITARSRMSAPAQAREPARDRPPATTHPVPAD
jgi:drug/metabolite transporter (DMT)-like permease